MMLCLVREIIGTCVVPIFITAITGIRFTSTARAIVPALTRCNSSVLSALPTAIASTRTLLGRRRSTTRLGTAETHPRCFTTSMLRMACLTSIGPPFGTQPIASRFPSEKENALEPMPIQWFKPCWEGGPSTALRLYNLESHCHQTMRTTENCTHGLDNALT